MQLDALFAGGRRRRTLYSQPVTSATTTAPCSAEAMLDLYPLPPMPTENGVYVPSPSRSSYTGGNARKSLLAYIDHESITYTEVRARRGSLGAAAALDAGVEAATRGLEAAARPQTSAAMAPSQIGAGAAERFEQQKDVAASPARARAESGGFLASVWALGTYFRRYSC